MEKRRFIVGDEWLYFKIYSGPVTLEKVLFEVIYRIADDAFRNKMIGNFHFVRYYDDDHHLRIRFLVNKIDHILTIINLINEGIGPYVSTNLVWKVNIDTYEREMERYGGERCIESVENIFTLSSMSLLSAWRTEANILSDQDKWLVGIRTMDLILNRFGFDDKRKLAIYNSYFEAYSQEFSLTKPTKETLQAKFRTNRSVIEKVMSEESVSLFTFDLEGERKIDFSISTILDAFFSNLDDARLISLIQAVIHMHFNRVFRTKPRESEFVIYYMMTKIYTSRIARNKII
jgi:thiopeptide-type bacteriocin biosynthesis protein